MYCPWPSLRGIEPGNELLHGRNEARVGTIEGSRRSSYCGPDEILDSELQNRFHSGMDLKLFKKLNAGAGKILINAVALYREAVLLAENRAWSRALFLHQISMEECAKVEVLGASAATLLMGEKASFKHVADVFRSHEKKNRVNAYFLEPSAKEQSAGRSGRLKDAIAAFEVIQDRFHARSNLEKNAALYVDLQGEEFEAPVERITAKMVATADSSERGR
jgi:AbiV family abortive infection protein